LATIHQRYRQTDRTVRQTDNGPIGYSQPAEPFYKRSPNEETRVRRAVRNVDVVKLTDSVLHGSLRLIDAEINGDPAQCECVGQFVVNQAAGVDVVTASGSVQCS